MTPAVGLLASQLIVVATGYALLRALGIAELKGRDLRLVGLSYFVGWAVLGVLVSLGLMLRVGESLPEILVLVAVEVGLCFWFGRSTVPIAEPRSPVVQSRHSLAVAVCWLSSSLIAVATLSAAATASKVESSPVHNYDAFNFWIPKAQIIYESHGLNAELWKLFAHPEYPPLAPAMDALTFLFAGMHPSLLVTQRTLLGIAFLLSLVTLLGRFVPRWILFPFVAALATAPWFWPRLGSLMIDAPVAYLVGGAVTSGFIWLHEPHRRWLILTWIFMAAAGLSKFEGFWFAEILAVTIVAAAALRYRMRALPASALLLAPLCLGLWRFWLSRHGVPTANSEDYHLSDLLDPQFLSERTFRLTIALHAFRRELESLVAGALGGSHLPAPSGWVLALPWVVVFALLARRFRLLATAAAVWIAGAFAGLAVIYWIGRPGIGWYIYVTLDRVAPTIVISSGVLATLLLGLEFATRTAPEPVAAPAAVRPALSRTRRAPAIAIAFAVGALAVLVIADGRPTVLRAGPVDAAALSQELTAQFRLELHSAGYLYDISSTCSATTPDGLTYACLISTTGPVAGERHALQWHTSVSCRPTATDTPRCYTNQGEALD